MPQPEARVALEVVLAEARHCWMTDLRANSGFLVHSLTQKGHLAYTAPRKGHKPVKQAPGFFLKII
jgi:hypothetical protein